LARELSEHMEKPCKLKGAVYRLDKYYKDSIFYGGCLCSSEMVLAS